ncbi:ComF family protein [Holzapfeliella sp. He02]|uniref:ComF family protein n=1 Tax=Holzapfeliella saturejae TaxID=3082953 RepID=A0ABU8SFP2_9LACO
MGLTCLLCQNQFKELNLYQLFRQKQQRLICYDCYQQFENIQKNTTRCQFCQKKLVAEAVCNDCRRWQIIYPNDCLKNTACYQYNLELKNLIRRYKRYHDASSCEIFVALIESELKKKQYDYYVCLPSSPKHSQERQFDHIELIFSKIIKPTSILTYVEQQHYQAQGEKNRQERLLTTQMFTCQDFKFDKYTRILLLDDIYTTGRTLYHARDAIRKVGFLGQIDSFTIAR